MDGLSKARAIRKMVSQYKHQHKGTSDTAARHALGIPAPDTPALKAWTPPAHYLKGSTMASKPKNSSSTLVCDPGGGVTTRSSLHLNAKIPAHQKVEFSGPALGAIAQGLLQQLLYGSSVNAASIFPGMYPDLSKANERNPYCSEIEIGAETAKPTILGTALKVFDVTPEQWASFYVELMAGAAQLPRQFPRGQMQNGNGYTMEAGPVQIGDVGNGFSSPLGDATQETSDFGDNRG